MEDHQREAFEADLTERLVACAELLRRDLASRACEANLTRPDFIALREIARREAPTTPADLAESTRCSRTQVWKITKRLLSAKYVEEHRNHWIPQRRTFTVTPSGLEALSRAMRTFEVASSFAQLTLRQQQQLNHLLGRLLQADVV